MRSRCWLAPCVAGVIVSWSVSAWSYPTDEFERTQIRRLQWQHDVDTGARRGRKLPSGATWPSSKITLKMLGARDYRLTSDTQKDPGLQEGLEAIMRRPDFRGYGVALLDISDPSQPRYAAVHETEALLPGSVAKLAIGAGFFRLLKERFPNDLPAREAFLRETKVVADEWALPNSHEVPVVDGDKVSIRPVRAGDTFTLWEWVDHMLSPSSNAAGSMVWRETTLMSLLGKDYPPPAYDSELWKRFGRDALTEAAYRVVDAPLIEVGIDPATLKLRLFFTKNASKYVKGDDSRATPLALLQWMVAVEQGRMVDEFSSMELKRMLYLTRRRVRYAKAKVLDDKALFFKSGSYYRCVPEPDYTCTAYQGNANNILNVLVEVEAPAPEAPAGQKAAPHTLVYIIAVMSNELRKNSADQHALLAGYVHELVQQ